MVLPVSADAVAWSADGTQLAYKGPEGVYVVPMRAIGDNLRSAAEVTPWLVPDSAAVSKLAWSKKRLRLHMAGCLA